MKKMWPKLRSSMLLRKPRHLGMQGGRASSELRLATHANSSMHSTINVNDEYKKALRSKSFVDVCSRIRRHLPRSAITTPLRPRLQGQTTSPNQELQDDSTATCTSPLTLTPTSSAPPPSSSPFSYSQLPDYLLEPRNDVAALLGAVRDPDLQALFLDYFEATLQACNICGSLLGSIDQLRREQRTLRRQLGTAAAIDCAGLAAYVELENPLSSLTTPQFLCVHDVHESLIQRLLLARDGIMRRARLARLAKRALAIALVAACGMATAALVVAAHAVGVLAVAGGPALVGPFSEWVKRRRRRRRRRRAGPGRLARLGVQLDTAARGAYIVSRDMETISRMVARLHDEVEHGKEVVRLLLRSRQGWVMRELADRGDGGGGGGFAEQLDELEEHVYWCLLTISRIRGLVVREITADASPSCFGVPCMHDEAASARCQEGQ